MTNSEEPWLLSLSICRFRKMLEDDDAADPGSGC